MGGEFAAPSLKRARRRERHIPWRTSMGGEFAAPSLKRIDKNLSSLSKICMGGEFAAPSLKLRKSARPRSYHCTGMGGEFAAPSLKPCLRHKKKPLTHVWAANLPPPH